MQSLGDATAAAAAGTASQESGKLGLDPSLRLRVAIEHASEEKAPLFYASDPVKGQRQAVCDVLHKKETFKEVNEEVITNQLQIPHCVVLDS